MYLTALADDLNIFWIYIGFIENKELQNLDLIF